MQNLVPSGTSTAGGTQSLAAGQYLTFSLADERYGVEITRVVEIKGWTPVTHIPNLPAYVCGVLNLRGQVIPIIDLRRRMNLEPAEYTSITVVIIINVRSADGNSLSVGMVVDSVDEVMDVRPDEFKPTPDFGAAVPTDFVRGIAATEAGMIILLDVDRLFRDRELSGLETLAETAPVPDREPVA